MCVPQEIISFLLAPDARDLRPLLVSELSTFSDLLLRDRTRRSVAALPAFAPRLPFFGALPLPPAPPIYLPGIGFKAVAEAVDILAPPLTASEQVYLQSLTELGASLLGELFPGTLEWQCVLVGGKICVSPIQLAQCVKSRTPGCFLT